MVHGRKNERRRSESKINLTEPIGSKRNPSTHKDELGTAGWKYKLISETVEFVVLKAIPISQKLGILENNFKYNGSNLSENNTPYVFVHETLKLQEELKALDLTSDENCCSIFAHKFFLLGVYVYPENSYTIALILHGFFKSCPSRLHRNVTFVTELKKILLSVLNKTTVYDGFVNPERFCGSERELNFKLLENKYPALKSIKSDDRGTLKKRIKQRHLNTATFTSYLICILCDNGAENFLIELLSSLSYTIDTSNFFAIHRLFDICSHLIPYDSNIVTKTLARLSKFLESVRPENPNITKFHKMFGDLYTSLVVNRDLVIRDKQKILKQLRQTDPNMGIIPNILKNHSRTCQRLSIHPKVSNMKTNNGNLNFRQKGTLKGNYPRSKSSNICTYESEYLGRQLVLKNLTENFKKNCKIVKEELKMCPLPTNEKNCILDDTKLELASEVVRLNCEMNGNSELLLESKSSELEIILDMPKVVNGSILKAGYPESCVMGIKTDTYSDVSNVNICTNNQNTKVESCENDSKVGNGDGRIQINCDDDNSLLNGH